MKSADFTGWKKRKCPQEHDGYIALIVGLNAFRVQPYLNYCLKKLFEVTGGTVNDSKHRKDITEGS